MHADTYIGPTYVQGRCPHRIKAQWGRKPVRDVGSGQSGLQEQGALFYQF